MERVLDTYQQLSNKDPNTTTTYNKRTTTITTTNNNNNKKAKEQKADRMMRLSFMSMIINSILIGQNPSEGYFFCSFDTNNLNKKKPKLSHTAIINRSLTSSRSKIILFQAAQSAGTSTSTSNENVNVLSTNNNNNNNGNKNKKDNNNQGGDGDEEEWIPNTALFPYIDDSLVILLAPAIMSSLAYYSFEDTTTLFNDFIDVVSKKNWEIVDGGSSLAAMITPALNGPVASFIGLLFGTLTSMTVSTLYERQVNLSRILGELLEDLRLIEIHSQYFPKVYHKRVIKIVDLYIVGLLKNMSNPDVATRKNREAGRILGERLMTLLHDLTQYQQQEGQEEQQQHVVPDHILTESYDTVNRILRLRNNLITTYDTRFNIWHYGNLTLLAMGILLTFLIQTDYSALLFLGGLQLRLCWAMLIGTITMLGIVIYDLNMPLSGTYQVRKNINKVFVLFVCL